MYSMKMVAVCLLGLSVLGTSAFGDVFITEYMYSGSGGEFMEFTNLGNDPVDFTGWSYDDDSREPGTVDLTGFGTVMPGESVILTEDSEAGFEFFWNLTDVKIIGELETNIGRNDEINLYNAADELVDRLDFGDEDFPGSFRAQEISAWPVVAGLGANDVYQWVASTGGDLQNSYLSSNGDLGNPGVYNIPEPASLALLALGASMMGIRRR